MHTLQHTQSFLSTAKTNTNHCITINTHSMKNANAVIKRGSYLSNKTQSLSTEALKIKSAENGLGNIKQ